MAANEKREPTGPAAGESVVAQATLVGSLGVPVLRVLDARGR